MCSPGSSAVMAAFASTCDSVSWMVPPCIHSYRFSTASCNCARVASLKAIKPKIPDTNYEVIVAGESTVKDTGTCTLDTSVTPHRITIKSTEGTNKGKTILAIAEMPDANSMRVCYDLGGKEFPKK